MLRRTKTSKLNGKPIVSLPPRIVELEVGVFSPEEREFYDNLKRSVESELKTMSAAGSLSSNYVNILWMLLRLRQACNHPHLVKGAKRVVAAQVSRREEHVLCFHSTRQPDLSNPREGYSLADMESKCLSLRACERTGCFWLFNTLLEHSTASFFTTFFHVLRKFHV